MIPPWHPQRRLKLLVCLSAALQALPNWSLLQLAGHPVAVGIPNCAEVPQIRAASYATVRIPAALEAGTSGHAELQIYFTFTLHKSTSLESLPTLATLPHPNP